MAVEKYKELIGLFLAGEIPPVEFQLRYLNMFSRERVMLPHMTFQVLDNLFAMADAYSPECPPGKETNYEISEQRLRDEAETALSKLG